MKVAEYGIVKWYKNEAGFRYIIPDDLVHKRGFLKCLNCKARLYDWTCGNCLKKMKFGDFNVVTRNFLKYI